LGGEIVKIKFFVLVVLVVLVIAVFIVVVVVVVVVIVIVALLKPKQQSQSNFFLHKNLGVTSAFFPWRRVCTIGPEHISVHFLRARGVTRRHGGVSQT